MKNPMLAEFDAPLNVGTVQVGTHTFLAARGVPRPGRPHLRSLGALSAALDWLRTQPPTTAICLPAQKDQQRVYEAAKRRGLRVVTEKVGGEYGWLCWLKPQKA